MILMDPNDDQSSDHCDDKEMVVWQAISNKIIQQLRLYVKTLCGA